MRSCAREGCETPGAAQEGEPAKGRRERASTRCKYLRRREKTSCSSSRAIHYVPRTSKPSLDCSLCAAFFAAPFLRSTPLSFLPTLHSTLKPKLVQPRSQTPSCSPPGHCASPFSPSSPSSSCSFKQLQPTKSSFRIKMKFVKFVVECGAKERMILSLKVRTRYPSQAVAVATRALITHQTRSCSTLLLSSITTRSYLHFKFKRTSCISHL